MKDLSSSFKCDANVYNWMVVKNFSDLPSSKLDSHEKPFVTIQILVKLMRVTSVFLLTFKIALCTCQVRVGAIGFLLQNFEKWHGPTNGISSFYE